MIIRMSGKSIEMSSSISGLAQRIFARLGNVVP